MSPDLSRTIAFGPSHHLFPGDCMSDVYGFVGESGGNFGRRIQWDKDDVPEMPEGITATVQSRPSGKYLQIVGGASDAASWEKMRGGVEKVALALGAPPRDEVELAPCSGVAWEIVKLPVGLEMSEGMRIPLPEYRDRSPFLTSSLCPD
ncbi:hypothetical protein CMO91_03070 [Candidatus Woesearchaeota archaeon]|nr:hypothetical protein [Candidatus Woesearchaeota archaeon]|tara:strand:- start:2233 stop:2679 length:447 start_codon:yes stop_codon:yes gene_type:complete